MVLSPITGKEAFLIKSYNTEAIIKEYKETLNIETEKYFQEVSSCDLYLCEETGYRFFLPDTTAGDGLFYQQLEKFSWYYMKWKWEHTFTKQILKRQDTVLEVGCASGSFLKTILDENIVQSVTGIELNKKAADRAKANGLEVYNETIENFSLQKKLYTIVCSFQVLEHISQIHSFINSSLKCLAKGGKLIICVPNNNSFIKYEDGGILNFPPHHMGWWDNYSLQKLESFYQIKLLDIAYEPLQRQHYSWYLNILKKRLKIDNNPILKKIFFNKFTQPIYIKVIALFSKKINGHSIIAVYEKL